MPGCEPQDVLMQDPSASSAAAYEQAHVHEVYEHIASHFSSTRYKPWPIVARFLDDLPSGSIGVDVGCGNGKYLCLNAAAFVLGSDRSENLAEIASRRGGCSDCVVADGIATPHPNNRFDFALSIAVVHHFSTRIRRIAAIEAVLAAIRPEQGGKALFFVWALEQKGSRRGWTAADEQDVMVPWVTKAQGGTGGDPQTFNRYYHLYREGELTEDIGSAGGKIVESGYDRDNWWAVATKGSLSSGSPA